MTRMPTPSRVKYRVIITNSRRRIGHMTFFKNKKFITILIVRHYGGQIIEIKSNFQFGAGR